LFRSTPHYTSSFREIEKYKEEQKRITLENSLKELEDDIKQIANKGGKDK